MKLIENEKQDHEITRLLYVAATRAKKRLFLFAQIAWDDKKSAIQSPKKGSFLEKLLPIYESALDDLRPTHSTRDHAATEKSGVVFSRLPHHFFNTPSSTEVETIEPVHFDIQPTINHASIIGTIAHEVFQSLMQYEHSSAKWQSRLRASGLPQNICDQANQLIEKSVNHFFQSKRGKWILSDRHHKKRAEYPLTFCDDTETHHVVIDLTFIDEQGVRWIIDYKTATPTEEESREAFLAREIKQYRPQLEQYAKVMSQMENNPIYLGLYFPVCDEWVEWEYGL